MAIFHHQDCDGDSVELLADSDDPQDDLVMLFSSRTGERAGGVRVDRDAALHLHAALGEWLYPVHTPEGPNRSLIEQMIERAVKDQVAAVLPLHLSQGGAIRISGPCKGHVDAERDHDPEPGDVGHPRPAAHQGPCGEFLRPGTRLDDVHDCGYRWGTHRAVEPQHGRLMAELPRRIRQLPEPGCVCGHGWMEHYSSMCWGGEEKYGCRCTQVRPAPVPVQEYCGRCTHSWSRHVGAGCNVRIPGGECGCEEMHP